MTAKVSEISSDEALTLFHAVLAKSVRMMHPRTNAREMAMQLMEFVVNSDLQEHDAKHSDVWVTSTFTYGWRVEVGGPAQLRRLTVTFEGRAAGGNWHPIFSLPLQLEWRPLDAEVEAAAQDAMPELLRLLSRSFPEFRTRCEQFAHGKPDFASLRHLLLDGSPEIDRLQQEIVTLLACASRGVEEDEALQWILQYASERAKYARGVAVSRLELQRTPDVNLTWVVEARCAGKGGRTQVSFACHRTGDVRATIFGTKHLTPKIEDVHMVHESMETLLELVHKNFPNAMQRWDIFAQAAVRADGRRRSGKRR